VAKVGFFYSDAVRINWNSSYWRCYLPARKLAPKHDVVLAHINTLPAYSHLDVFFLERNLFDPYLTFLEDMKRKGKKVYCTWDDNYALMPRFLPGHSIWKEKLPEFLQGLGEIDGSLVPCQALVDYYSKYGNVKLVGNFYPKEWLDAPVNNIPEFELGVSCSISHLESIKNSHILEALKIGKHSLLLNAGQSHELMNIMAGIYTGYQSWTRQQDYPEVVDRFSIGLAPLAGDYDNYRSNLKVLLYAVRGRTWVASNLIPYQGIPGGILVKNTVEGWKTGIEAAIESSHILSEVAREWAQGFTIDKNIEKYLELIG